MLFKPFHDLSLSRLGMGNMRLPLLPGGTDRDIDEEKTQQILDYAMAHGVNYYDTAYVYHGGQSERVVGRALSKYPRESYYLATKYPIGVNPDHKAVFEEQLERLGTGRIDFYLLHCVQDNNVDAYLTGGCIDYLLEQQERGRIGFLGFSNHGSPETLERFASHHQWDFAQLQLNYFDWQYRTARQEYEILDGRGIPVMVMEPVRGGRLATLSPAAEELLRQAHPDWSIPSWAFRWLKTLPRVQVVLSGMSSLEQIVDNVATFEDDRALTPEETQLLFRACELFRDQVQVPCTACRYCTDSCPAGIDIPEVLKLYNRYKTDGPWALGGLKKLSSKGSPADCVSCGACTGHCPQSIRVPEIMKELADKLGEAPA